MPLRSSPILQDTVKDLAIFPDNSKLLNHIIYFKKALKTHDLQQIVDPRSREAITKM